MKKNTILVGDVLEKLKEIPGNSIDCIVTSPPYFGLRDYGTAKWEGGNPVCDHKGQPLSHQLSIHERTQPQYNNQPDTRNFEIYKAICKKCGAKRIDLQIGLEPTLEEYLTKLLAVTAELRRVLKPTGTLFWNHGDSYGTGSGSGIRYRKQATNRGTQTNKNWQESGKPPVKDYEKSLLLQNFRLAQRMVDEQKWLLRNVLIWHKRNCMPSSVKDRFTVDYEPVFFFVKSKKYWFETQYEPFLSNTYDRARMANARTEYGGKWAQESNGAIKMQRAFVAGNKEGRNKRCVWSINSKSSGQAHFATFPEKLIEPMIKAGCPEFICKMCGKASERIEKISYQIRAIRSSQEKHFDTGKTMARKNMSFMGNKVVENLGYTDCGCNAGWVSGIILDPFMGSGTTAVVANKLRRDWIGIELNQDYVKIAERRIAENPKPMI